MTTDPIPEGGADFRALCDELVRLVERCPVTSDTDWICDRNELIVRFRNARRAVLAQPAPEPPTSKELQALWGACSSPSVFARAIWSRAVGQLQPAPEPPTDQQWEDEALNAYHTASIDPGTSARSPEPPAGPVKGPTLEDIDEMCERRNFGFYYDDWGPSDHDSRLVLQSMMVETLARWGKGNG